MALALPHHPRCAGSRRSLALPHARRHRPESVEPLETPPSEARVEVLPERPGMPPRELPRKPEAPCRELGLDDPAPTRAQLVAARAAHPAPVEGPIAVRGFRAAKRRPPEDVLATLRKRSSAR